MLDPERPVTPPDTPEKTVICPVCGAIAQRIYFDDDRHIFGCDICVKHDFVDDVLDIPESKPLPKCHCCGKQEQSVYIDIFNEIRGCINCVEIKKAIEAGL